MPSEVESLVVKMQIEMIVKVANLSKERGKSQV